MWLERWELGAATDLSSAENLIYSLSHRRVGSLMAPADEWRADIAAKKMAPLT